MLTTKIKLMFTFIVILTCFTAFNRYAHPELPVTTSPTKVDATQLACMAKNIFYEAGNESIHGQAAVARVVMNRISYGFAKNPCGVVYQKTEINNKFVCQFSWVCEGKAEPNKNTDRYKMAEQVAFDVMVNGRYSDVVPKSTLFFHSINIDPLWPHKKVATIGGHVFYSKVKRPQLKNVESGQKI